ncbi:hypothetical protein J8281_05980 [Aquimarina sp. U1-2]|uniref:hypothetical protein n=1 Tax=Aquimarina sp. U1-2 TaxID=2823141 RepID=UPI001AECF2C0|nr:hypothetical protein [Aquimarina sp. U1-2]MBP2831733.1 hypothetical protein [Aquimarina sp. U1-2]
MLKKTVDDRCVAYFIDEKATEIDKNILDFTTTKTPKVISIPSYTMEVYLSETKKKT